MLREIGILAILFYQKFLSSKKGYICAKGHINGTGTCSSSTLNAFKNGGFISGMKEYRKSKKECREAYEKSTSRTLNTGDVASATLDVGTNALVGSAKVKGSVATAGLEASTGAVSSGVEAVGSSACDAGACDIGAC